MAKSKQGDSVPSVPEDVENSASSKAALIPKRQDPREITRMACGYSATIPAIRRIRDEEKKDQMLSRWNVSWPNSVKGPGHWRSQAADDDANTSGTAQGTLGISTTTANAEGQFLVSGDSQTSDISVQAVQQELEEPTEGETAGQFLVICCCTGLAPSEEAETARSASLLDSGPGPAGQLESVCLSHQRCKTLNFSQDCTLSRGG